MKHAYLILAHNEWDVLQALLKSIDDIRNDIYLHIDHKVKQLPVLVVKHANLKLLTNRIDVHWGDISIVQAELALFAAAHASGPYAYYHLLSGVDLPLRTQDEIHSFCAAHQGIEFIGFYHGKRDMNLSRKAQRYHLFPHHFRPKKTVFNRFRQIIRYLGLYMQEKLNIKRNTDITIQKGSQWVSVTEEFVTFLLAQRSDIFRRFHHTFCPDEFYKQTLCFHSKFYTRVYDIQNEGRSCLRMVGWKNNKLETYTMKDYHSITLSKACFARKFSAQSPELIQAVLKKTLNFES